MVYRVIVIDEKHVRLVYAKSRISNDRGEYIMNRGALRANQHAEKYADCAWLPMRVSKKGVWEELEQNFCDVEVLRRKLKNG